MNIEQPWSTHVISSVVTPFSATCSVCRTSVWTKNSSKSMTTSLLHTFVSWRYDLGVADVALADLVMAVIESGSLKEKYDETVVYHRQRFVGKLGRSKVTWHGALGKPFFLVRQFSSWSTRSTGGSAAAQWSHDLGQSELSLIAAF